MTGLTGGRHHGVGSAGFARTREPVRRAPTWKPVTVDIPDWMREAPWFGRKLPEPIPETGSASRLRQKLNERRRREAGWL